MGISFSRPSSWGSCLGADSEVKAAGLSIAGDFQSVGMYLKTVLALPEARAVNLEFEFVNEESEFGGFSDNDNQVTVGADFYFTPLVSLGAELRTFTDDFGDPLFYEIRARAHANTRLGFALAYAGDTVDSEDYLIDFSVVGRW